ncbi:MAG: hypothetical protein AVDCRST_MAG16-1772, partial [uncultured Frankineae bacterium]
GQRSDSPRHRRCVAGRPGAHGAALARLDQLAVVRRPLQRRHAGAVPARRHGAVARAGCRHPAPAHRARCPARPLDAAPGRRGLVRLALLARRHVRARAPHGTDPRAAPPPAARAAGAARGRLPRRRPARTGLAARRVRWVRAAGGRLRRPPAPPGAASPARAAPSGGAWRRRPPHPSPAASHGAGSDHGHPRPAAGPTGPGLRAAARRGAAAGHRAALRRPCTHPRRGRRRVGPGAGSGADVRERPDGAAARAPGRRPHVSRPLLRRPARRRGAARHRRPRPRARRHPRPSPGSQRLV